METFLPKYYDSRVKRYHRCPPACNSMYTLVTRTTPRKQQFTAETQKISGFQGGVRLRECVTCSNLIIILNAFCLTRLFIRIHFFIRLIDVIINRSIIIIDDYISKTCLYRKFNIAFFCNVCQRFWKFII